MLARFSPGLFRILPVALFIAFVSNNFAETPAPEVPKERTLLAERYAAERLAVWQKRLNLQDWNIALVVSRASELKPKTLGNIHWDNEKKTAVLRVLDPA